MLLRYCIELHFGAVLYCIDYYRCDRAERSRAATPEKIPILIGQSD